MARRVLGIFFALMMVTSNALAWFSMSGLKGLWRGEADNYQRQIKAGYGHLPQGLTFYKDFTKIPAGTHSDTKLLTADYSIGSPVATFTSTSGSFTIASSGYNSYSA